MFTKPIVIATSNQDKFNLYSRILSALGLPNKFVSLSELNIVNDVPESGTIIDRAVQKAQFCLDHLSPEQINEYGCIVSIDTGLKLPTLDIETAESKKLAARILNGELLSAGDPIHPVNGCAFILLPSKKLMTVEVETPFKYLGNPQGLRVEEGKNVLGFVVSQPELDTPNEEISKEIDTEYRMRFFKEALDPIINQIKNQ